MSNSMYTIKCPICKSVYETSYPELECDCGQKLTKEDIVETVNDDYGYTPTNTLNKKKPDKALIVIFGFLIIMALYCIIYVISNAGSSSNSKKRDGICDACNKKATYTFGKDSEYCTKHYNEVMKSYNQWMSEQDDYD